MSDSKLETVQQRNLTWDDPIDWKELGVFTDENVIWELLAVCVGSIMFFLI